MEMSVSVKRRQSRRGIDSRHAAWRPVAELPLLFLQPLLFVLQPQRLDLLVFELLLLTLLQLKLLFLKRRRIALQLLLLKLLLLHQALLRLLQLEFLYSQLELALIERLLRVGKRAAKHHRNQG
jgi:hypothetical protein